MADDKRVSDSLRLCADRLHVLTSAPQDALPPERFRELLTHDLLDTERHLLKHFAAEESDGFLDSVVAGHPELEPRAQQLREQHDSLRRQFAELKQALAAGVDLATMCDRVSDVLESFDAHEHAERELVAHSR